MAHEYDKLVRRWFEEVWNQSNEATVDEMFAIDGIAHGLGENSTDAIGPEGFKTFMRGIRAVMPVIRIDVQETIVQGQNAAARLILTGTHTGSGAGLAASGRRVSVTAITFVKFSDSKIIEAWNNWDQYGMLQQMGVLPQSDPLLSVK